MRSEHLWIDWYLSELNCVCAQQLFPPPWCLTSFQGNFRYFLCNIQHTSDEKALKVMKWGRLVFERFICSACLNGKIRTEHIEQNYVRFTQRGAVFIVRHKCCHFYQKTNFNAYNFFLCHNLLHPFRIWRGFFTTFDFKKTEVPLHIEYCNSYVAFRSV